MSYAKHIQEKKFAWKGRALATSFPSYGDSTFYGSIALGGAAYANEELAHTHADMLLEGTRRYTKKQIQVFIDSLGASLSFSLTGDRLTFSGRVRSAHLPQLLTFVAHVLKEPLFPQTELSTLKKRRATELSLEAKNTRTQASIELMRTLFAPGHPNWEQTTEESAAALARITKKELQTYHERIINRESLIISVAGDLPQKKVFAIIEKSFNKLPSGTVAPVTVAPTTQATRQIATPIADKASIDYLLATTTGITSDHADYPALILGLQILGSRGGFTGRLMRIVREKEGLTYGVYSYPAGFRATVDGYAVVWGTFAPQLFAQGRASIKREVARILKDGPTTTEVKKHAAMYAASMRTGCTSSGEFARAGHDTVAEGRSPSYLDTFPKKVLALTPKQVHQTLRNYINLDQCSESAAGPIEQSALSL